MSNRKRAAFAASIAAISLMAAPAVLAQGNGNGNGNGGGGNGAQAQGNGAQAQGNGGSNGGGEKANRGGGNRSNADRGNANRGNSGNGNGNSGQARRAQDNDRGDRANINRAVTRQNGNGNGGNANAINRGNNGNGNRANGVDTGSDLIRIRSRDGIDLDVDFALPQLLQALGQTLVREERVIGGCPPGLAKKRNGCLPPGQARKTYRSYDPGFFGLIGIGGGQYFYDDGYLLSYRGDGLAGYLPLLAGALGIGNVWPSNYAAAPLPDYYSSYYGLNDPRGYRFADNVIYRVDPETAAIASVAALLTGDDIAIGQPLPVGYDVYNVPYAYRNQYADGPGARYRYSDGYIYEVDPETALVVAAIDLVV